MINNDFVFRCPECYSRNHIYESIDIYQSKFKIIDNKYVTSNEKVICRFCHKPFYLNKKNFIQANLINGLEENKMKLEKEDVGSMFLTPSDIGDRGDKATLKIVKPSKTEDEIREVETEYGNRIVIPVFINEVEKQYTLSPTNKNALIDSLGDDTDKWYGKEFNVLVESCSIGKSGSKITVL